LFRRSPRHSWSRARARVRRDMTVPRGVPATAAISLSKKVRARS
jgi:hypothetical protein